MNAWESVRVIWVEWFDQIIREVYGETPSPSKTNSESSSLGFMDTLMETTGSLIDREVLSYDHRVMDDNYVSKFRSNNQVSFIRNEEDVMLKPYVVGERVYITQPRGVHGE